MSILKIQFRRFLNRMFVGMIVLSMTLGSFVPLAAHAACAKLSSGTLIKVKGHTAVYLLTGKKNDAGYPYRKYFPNAEVFYSWFSDFSNVVEIDGACIDEYQSSGGINYRPGSHLVKTDVSPNVYAIVLGNAKRLIPNEEVAIALYGADWASKVRILPDVFDANLTKGTPLPEKPAPHAGMVVRVKGDPALYYATGNTYQEIEPEDRDMFEKWANIVSQTVFDTFKLQFAQISKEEILKDPTQEGDLDLSTLPPLNESTLPGGQRLTVPWAEGTFSLEIPYTSKRTIQPDVILQEQDAYTPPGYLARVQISTEGTTYAEDGVAWFEPFHIGIIPRGWWDANAAFTPGVDKDAYELNLEEGPDKYVKAWYIYDDFVYIYKINPQDCPYVREGGKLIDSDLCGIRLLEEEMRNTFFVGQ